MPIVNPFLPDCDIPWPSETELAAKLRTWYGTYNDNGVNSEFRRFVFRDLHSASIIGVYLVGGLYFGVTGAIEGGPPSNSLLAAWIALPCLVLSCIVELRAHFFAKPTAVVAVARQMSIAFATLVLTQTWHFYDLRLNTCSESITPANGTSVWEVDRVSKCINTIDAAPVSALLIVIPTARIYPHHLAPILLICVLSTLLGWLLRPDVPPDAVIVAQHVVFFVGFGLVAAVLNGLRHGASVAQFETTSQLERVAEEMLGVLEKLDTLVKAALPPELDDAIAGDVLGPIVPLDESPTACVVGLKVEGFDALVRLRGVDHAAAALELLHVALNRHVQATAGAFKIACTADEYWVCAGLIDPPEMQADVCARLAIDAIAAPAALELHDIFSISAVAATGEAVAHLLTTPRFSVMVRGPVMKIAALALLETPKCSTSVCAATRRQLTDYVGCEDSEAFHVSAQGLQSVGFFRAFPQQLHHTPLGLGHQLPSDNHSGRNYISYGRSDAVSGVAHVEGPARISARYRRLGGWKTRRRHDADLLKRQRLLQRGGRGGESSETTSSSVQPMLGDVDDVSDDFGIQTRAGSFRNDELENDYEDFKYRSLASLRIFARWAFVTILVVVVVSILFEARGMPALAAVAFVVALLLAVISAGVTTAGVAPMLDGGAFLSAPFVLLIALWLSPSAVASHYPTYVSYVTLALVGPTAPQVPLPVRIAAQLAYTVICAWLSLDSPQLASFMTFVVLGFIFSGISLFVDDRLRRQHFIERRVSAHYVEQQERAHASQEQMLEKLVPSHMCGLVLAGLAQYDGNGPRAIQSYERAVVSIVELSSGNDECVTDMPGFGAYWDAVSKQAPGIILAWCVGDRMALVSSGECAPGGDAAACMFVLSLMPRCLGPKAVIHVGGCDQMVVGGSAVAFVVSGSAVEAASNSFGGMANSDSRWDVWLTGAACAAVAADGSPVEGGMCAVAASGLSSQHMFVETTATNGLFRVSQPPE